MDTTDPGTDRLSDLIVQWRREIDADAAKPAVTDYIAELARREHIAHELLVRAQRSPMPLAELEDLALRAHDVAVVERFLNAELDALRGGA